MTALFYFGAISPYSWFAAERIEELLPAADWRPVFAGGLFTATGRASWALTELRSSGIADCEQRALEHGLGPITWPQPWPTTDLYVARAMLVAESQGCLKPYALTSMRLAFKEGADLGATDAVLEAGRRADLDVGALRAALEDPQTKDRLRVATDEALAMGVFGVPTTIIDGTLFWGDDQLEEAARTSRVDRTGGRS